MHRKFVPPTVITAVALTFATAEAGGGSLVMEDYYLDTGESQKLVQWL